MPRAASSFSASRQCGRMACYILESVTVNDPHVASITELNDSPRHGMHNRPRTLSRKASPSTRHSECSHPTLFLSLGLFQ
jgi:hypothetical protein